MTISTNRTRDKRLLGMNAMPGAHDYLLVCYVVLDTCWIHTLYVDSNYQSQQTEYPDDGDIRD